MTEQEELNGKQKLRLILQSAKEISQTDRNGLVYLSETQVNVLLNRIIKEALPELAKEAGYKSPEQVMEMFEGFEKTIKLLREQKAKYDTSVSGLTAPDESRLVEEYMMLLQTPNGGKVIVDTTPALIRQDTKTASIKDTWYNKLLEDYERIKTDRAKLMDEVKGKDAELQKEIAWLDSAWHRWGEAKEAECQARMERIFREIRSVIVGAYQSNARDNTARIETQILSGLDTLKKQELK